MSKTKHWEISNLSYKQDLTSSAKIILRQRLETLLSAVNLYFNEISMENLHQVRISLKKVKIPDGVISQVF